MDTEEIEFLAAYYAAYEAARPALVVNLATRNANPDEEREFCEAPDDSNA